MMHVILLVYVWFGYCNCFDDITLKPFHLPNLHNKNLCEEDTQSTVVEDFFNNVFVEFPASQPACVCIQLCVGHPTFCYPNGCFKYIQGYVKDRTNSNIISVTLRSDTGILDDTTERKEETDIEKKFEYINKHEDLSTTFNFRRNHPYKIAITPRNRIFSIIRNPFKNRSQLSSFLKKGRRQKLSPINYYQLDNAEKTMAPLDPGKIFTYPLSVHHTNWPQDKDTVALAQAIGEWGTVLDKDEANSSSTLDEQTDTTEHNAENKLNDEVSEKNDSGIRFDLHFISYESNDTESAQNNFEVIPVKENATAVPLSKVNDKHFTTDSDIQKELTTRPKTPNLKVNNQSKTLDSITNILLNVTEKENEDYSFDTPKNKSFLFRRLPWFDMRRLKNQMRRKNRLGHLAQAQRFENKKSNFNLDLESESALHELRKNRKRDERTAANLERRINFRDLEMI